MALIAILVLLGLFALVVVVSVAWSNMGRDRRAVWGGKSRRAGKGGKQADE